MSLALMPVIPSRGIAQKGWNRLVHASPTPYAMMAFPMGNERQSDGQERDEGQQQGYAIAEHVPCLNAGNTQQGYRPEGLEQVGPRVSDSIRHDGFPNGDVELLSCT